MSLIYYSHGKLLLTSEYLVLDGAPALAVPTKQGQSLEVDANDSAGLIWKSYDVEGNLWLDYQFEFREIRSFDLGLKPNTPRKRLLQLLKTCIALNSAFLAKEKGISVKTSLEFPQDWGLGSSSTLINNFAQWAKVDPFELLAKTFGGSGYDIACAQENSAIIYRLNEGKPNVKTVIFDPPFKDKLFFIHLNQKQNSRQSIAHYRNQDKGKLKHVLGEAALLTRAFVDSRTLKNFEQGIDQHEQLISNLVQLSTVKSFLFPDYPHSIKSLGGWGGDFVLATGTAQDMEYFKAKGFLTVIPYVDIVLVP